MKRKWIIIISSWCLAIGLVGIGGYIKWSEGYILDTDEQIYEMVNELYDIPDYQIEILAQKDFQNKDNDIRMIAIKYPNTYLFLIFDKQANYKYKLDYVYESAEDVLHIMRDSERNLVIFHGTNRNHKISKLRILGGQTQSDSNQNYQDKDYIIECFEDSQSNILSILPLDELGDVIEREISEEDILR